MTFNPNADISGNTTRKRGGTAAIAGVGGVGVLGILALLVGPMLGVDLTGLFPAGDSGSSAPSTVLACESGQDANQRDECRMAELRLCSTTTGHRMSRVTGHRR